jgi:hypothetical protein
MARNVMMAYVGVGVMFAIIGTSFYLTYGDEGLLQSSFDYFPRSGSALGYSLVCLFNFTSLPFIPLYLITIVEQLEYFDDYKKWLTKEDGDFSLRKLVGVRVIVGSVVMA